MQASQSRQIATTRRPMPDPTPGLTDGVGVADDTHLRYRYWVLVDFLTLPKQPGYTGDIART